MNDETQGPDERKPFLHFGEILARSGVRSNDVDEICEGIGKFLDDSRTALLHYYDAATTLAKIERNPRAAKESLLMARNFIGLAITSLTKIEGGETK